MGVSVPKLGVLFLIFLESLVGLINGTNLVFLGLGDLTSRAKAHSMVKLSGIKDLVGEPVV